MEVKAGILPILFLVLHAGSAYLADEVYSIDVKNTHIFGTGLKNNKDSKGIFLIKFSDIEPDFVGVSLDVYTQIVTRKRTVPIVVFIGENDIARMCEDIPHGKLSEVIIFHVRGLNRNENIATCTRSENTECVADDIHNILVWIQRNVARFGGDKSRVTLVGFGREPSYVVSQASHHDKYRHLFQRIIVEFGEENWLHRQGFLLGQLRDEPQKIDPPSRPLLIGYDATTNDEDLITSIVDNIEAFANTGSRVTLFNRGQFYSSYKLLKEGSLFELSINFAASLLTSDDRFPQSNLGEWRDGVRVLDHTTTEGWVVVKRKNLFEVPDTKATDEFPEITISLGPLRGRHLVRGEYQADGFYHIPFSRPTGRFEYSKMAEPWTDLLDARYPVRYKDCPQHVIMKFGHEDCINLHVFVPGSYNETLSGDPLPVMVFMHGGSYAVGTAGGFKIPGRFDNALYEGTVIADFRKVVVVSVNYRLAALGFLNDGDVSNGVLDGNYGSRDMVLALEWVKMYIGEFGGDPGKVTLFGESAGSAGTGLLSLSPMTKGLIHQSIQESGSPTSFFAVDFKPWELSKSVFTELGCRSENFTAVKDCLMQRGEFDFVAISTPTPYVPWRPTIDGVFLTEDPLITLSKRSNVPLLSGCNYDELYIIASTLVPQIITGRPVGVDDWNKIKEALGYVLLEYPDRQQYISDVILHSSLDWAMDFTTEQAKKILVRASSDYVFTAPQFQQALIRSQIPENAETYMYSFQIKSKLDAIHRDWATNSHAFELPYVFGEGLRRTERDPVYNATMDKLSRQMITYWTNFAKTGNPNEPVKDEIEELVWEPYDNVTKPYIALNFRMTTDNLRSDYRSYELELWDVLVPLMMEQDEEACAASKAQGPISSSKTSVSPKIRSRKEVKVGTSTSVRRASLSIKADTCNLSEDLVRETSLGCVRGEHTDYGGSGVETYLGIPYAKPPVDDLRFSPTECAESWEGVLDANAYMPDCPRNSSLEGQDEDCLYLNVYRPNNTETLPVMVWIHSDMNAGSAGPQYDGKRIAVLGNVVVVTFNYRIGVLGYLSTVSYLSREEDGDLTGNYGLFDQNMALHWVKDNIGNFGGDVSKITIFGDGDSSKAIGYHAVRTSEDENEALFTGIIHQSGVGQLDDNLPVGDLEGAKEYATRLGCSVDVTAMMIACLKNFTTEELMSEAENFYPVVVIDGVFLRDQPRSLFEMSTPRYFNYLIGFTSGEGSRNFEFVTGAVNDEETYKDYVGDNIVPEDEFTNSARVKGVVEYEYKDFESEEGTLEQKYQNAVMRMHGDKDVIAPSLLLANRTSLAQSTILRPRNRTYVCHLVSSPDDSLPDWIGAPSGSLEKYFWGALPASASVADQQLSDRIVKYWTSFARNGRPFGVNSDDSWKRYTVESGEYGEIQAESQFAVIKNFPRPKYATLWNILIPAIDIPFPCEEAEPPVTPEVSTANGVIVRGYAETTDDGRNYDVFRGLPYALPPIGDFRFAESEFVGNITSDGENSVRHATLKKPRCLQTVNGAGGGYASEDCLYLDIWRPSGVKLDSSPIMFWICNGGYSVGGPHGQRNDDYSCNVDGQLLALDGKFIFVRAQYRIGVFGFLSGGSTAPEGNAGLFDLRNALKWVSQNIGDFGGSKEKITLAGDGLGGVLALILAGTPAAIPDVTIQGVIAQSASLTAPWAYTTYPIGDYMDVAARVQCSSADTTDTLGCLRRTDALKLVAAAGNTRSDFPFAIFADTKSVTTATRQGFMESTISGISLTSIRDSLATIPVLSGLNGGAGYHFTVEAYPELQLIYGRRRLNPDLIKNMVDNDIYLSNFGTSYSDDQSQVLSNFYIPWGDTDNRNEIRRAGVDFHTDEGFFFPIYDDINFRLETANSQPSYFYVYEVRTSNGRRFKWLTQGGDLGSELRVLFQENEGDNTASLGSSMRKYWSNFVNRGAPNLPQSTSDRWPRYNVDDKSTMIFDTSGFKVVSGYRDQAYRIWSEVTAPPTTAPTTTSATTTGKVLSCPPATTRKTTDSTLKTCPAVPVLGTGIGLELTTSQADIAINTLFGISLSFACVLTGAGIYYAFIMKKRKTSRTPSHASSSVISNDDAEKRPPNYNELSSL